MTEDQKIIRVLNEAIELALSVKARTNTDVKKIHTIVSAIKKVSSKIQKHHDKERRTNSERV